MKKIFICISVLFMLMLITNCRVVDFTIISSKNVTLDVKKDAPRVTGRGFHLKTAIDHAIEKAGSGFDALIDGVVYQGFFGRYKVVGTPIKTTEKK